VKFYYFFISQEIFCFQAALSLLPPTALQETVALHLHESQELGENFNFKTHEKQVKKTSMFNILIELID